jgi:hypothetical protein
MMLRRVGPASLLLSFALTVHPTVAHRPASTGAHHILAAPVTTTHTALTNEHQLRLAVLPR